MQLSSFRQVANTKEEKYELGFAYLMNWVSVYMKRLKYIVVKKDDSCGVKQEHQIKVDFESYHSIVFPFGFLDGMNYPAPYPLKIEYDLEYGVYERERDHRDELENLYDDDQDMQDADNLDYEDEDLYYQNLEAQNVAELRVSQEKDKETYKFLQSTTLTELINGIFKKYKVEHEDFVYNFRNKYKGIAVMNWASHDPILPFQRPDYKLITFFYPSYEEFLGGIIGFVNNAIKTKGYQPVYDQSLIEEFKLYCLNNHGDTLRHLCYGANIPLYKSGQNTTLDGASVVGLAGSPCQSTI